MRELTDAAAAAEQGAAVGSWVPAVAAAFIALILLTTIIPLCGGGRQNSANSAPGQPLTGSSMTPPAFPPPPPPPVFPFTSGAAPGVSERDSTVEAVLQNVHTVCQVSGGTLAPGKVIKRESIRTTPTAVIMDVSTNYSVEETVIYYADRRMHTRHLKMQNMMSLEDFMPAVAHVYEEAAHPGPNGVGLTVLPPAIFFSKATPLAVRLAQLETLEEQQQELFGMWQSLARVLEAFHQSGWFVRNITRENVVHVRRGANVGWTLLEFGNTSSRKSKVGKSTIPARQAPPELADAMLRVTNEPLSLTGKYDMWQLGVMVYEIMTGRPYWHPQMKDSQVLSYMANHSRPLPHISKPVSEPKVQGVIASLLQRDPEQRIDAKTLQKCLVTDLGTLLDQTLNDGTARGTSTVILGT